MLITSALATGEYTAAASARPFSVDAGMPMPYASANPNARDFAVIGAPICTLSTVKQWTTTEALVFGTHRQRPKESAL